MAPNILKRSFPVLSFILIFALTPTSFARHNPVVDKVPPTTQTAQTPSRVLPPTQYIPDHDFDTRHVALDLSFDWTREEVKGVETMSFRPLLSNLRKIELDAAEMTISSVKMAEVGALKYEIDRKSTRLNSSHRT